MSESKQTVLVRYWGSHFKSARQVEMWRQLLAPVVQRGWRCHLVLERLPEDDSWAARIRDSGVELVCLPRARRHFDPACVKRAFRLCRRLGADVIHCENIYTSPLIGAFLARVPARLWTRNNLNNDFEQCRPPTWRERIAPSTRLSCALATRVIAVSPAVKDELLGMGISGRRVLVRPNFRTALPAVLRDRDQIRTGLGYAKSDIVTVALGHAVPVKGWDLLLRAFQQVYARDRRARLLFVGSTTAPHERACGAELKQFVQEHQLADAVKFTDRHVNDVTQYLSAADVFVMASRSEAFCHALVEALELGLPCVATRVGIAAAAIRDGVNGFVVERNQWRPLADRLEALVTDDRLRADLAGAARVPEFIPTLPDYAEEMAKLYESLL